jgi:hydrogenase expression/formation protein HypE
MRMERHVTLAHGNGGRFMRELIDEIFVRNLRSGALDVELDAAPIGLSPELETVVTTDAFTVQPLEFPGGDIGSLAVNGTVNDLAVSGATPLFMTLNAVIEEGLEIALLERIARSLGRAAEAAGVQVVGGDTKVVPRGEGGGLYLASTGIGQRGPGCALGMRTIRPGDAVLVSGPVGDHGIAVMLARGDFELAGEVTSDCASVAPLALPVSGMSGVRFMRDPTRGGLATVAHEIARATLLDVHVEEERIPVRGAVRTVCEILGYDPFYLACEGRAVAVVAPEAVDEVLALWQGLPGGREAARIGAVRVGKGDVVLRTPIGGMRLLDELEDDPLPRIC